MWNPWRIFIVAFMLLATPLHAYDFEGTPLRIDFSEYRLAKGWSWWDTGLLAGFWLISAADLSQSVQIDDNPGMYETNQWIGRNPSDDEMRKFFLVSRIAITCLYVACPWPLLRRTIIFWLDVGETDTVIKNKNKYGLKVGFKM